MKKRLGLILLTVVVACFALFGLSACDSNVEQLQTNKKYIYSSDVGEDADKQAYYIFNSDGTGKYRYYFYFDIDSIFNEDYTVKFRYTYVDNDKSAVVCLFDSVTYGSDNGTYRVSTTWTKLLSVSKNVLCIAGTGGYGFYINQDYLKTVPNFGS